MSKIFLCFAILFSISALSNTQLECEYRKGPIEKVPVGRGYVWKLVKDQQVKEKFSAELAGDEVLDENFLFKSGDESFRLQVLVMEKQINKVIWVYKDRQSERHDLTVVRNFLIMDQDFAIPDNEDQKERRQVMCRVFKAKEAEKDSEF